MDARADQAEQTACQSHGIAFRDALRVWARVALLSFGGPAGQIAVMHRILVDEKRWIGEERFLHALNYCMLLPGPEAQQLAIYIGWLLHRTKGGLVAGLLFVLPGFVAILALSYVYVLLGHVPAIEGLFFGLKAAVLAIVVQAVVRVGSRALKNNVLRAMAAVAFVAIFFLKVPFPFIVLAAAMIGFGGGRAGVAAFRGGVSHGAASAALVHDRDTALGEEVPAHARPNLRWSFRLAGAFLLLWLGPVAALVLALGPDNVFSRIAIFFSEMAVVTFGGAYAVLAYVAQQAVQHYHWLSAPEMLTGLGLAETTPGPLIMVTQFVGFLGAYRGSGALNPLIAATLGAILTTWVTFTLIERIRGNRALSAALTGITAAVVGVILNLAVWFSLHALFERVEQISWPLGTLDVPVWTTLNVTALLLTLAAAIAVFRFKWGMLPVLGICAIAGVAVRLFGLI